MPKREITIPTKALKSKEFYFAYQTGFGYGIGEAQWDDIKVAHALACEVGIPFGEIISLSSQGIIDGQEFRRRMENREKHFEQKRKRRAGQSRKR